MYVGPFFYLESPRISHKGLIADLCPPAQAVTRDSKLYSTVTHQDLLARYAPAENYLDLPRGQVVFDNNSQMAIVYIDHCIERHLTEVVQHFELPAWVIEYDEQYVCPRCEHLADIF